MVKKLSNWIDTLDSARKNAIKLFAIITTIIAVGGWAIDMTVKVTNHFENKVKFEQAMTKKMEQLVIGQAINNELSQMQMARAGSYYFRTDTKGNTIEVSKDLTAMTGLSFNQVKNLGWINYSHDTCQDKLKARVKFTVNSRSDWVFIFPFYVRENYIMVKSEAVQVYTADSFLGWVGTITPLSKPINPVIQEKRY